MLSSKFFSAFSLLAFAVPALTVTVRINQLGDSITGSPRKGCWRALLWQKLQAAGITNTDFVGTLSGQGCGFPYDGENDGHGGFLATGIVRDNQLPGWLAVSQPDIVTMMLGTNDAWSHLGTTAILNAYTTLVGQMRAQNPKMVILVGQITPLNPSGCTDCNAQVVDLDAAIPAWAAGISTAQSPVTVVDLYTGYDTTTDTADGVHPNENGNAKIAAKWFAPLSAAIKSFGGSATTLITSTAKPSTSTVKPSSTTKSSTVVITTTTKTTSAPTPSSTGCSSGTLPLYSQCGGIGWAGGSTCQGCAKCVYSNDWYSQCLP